MKLRYIFGSWMITYKLRTRKELNQNQIKNKWFYFNNQNLKFAVYIYVEINWSEMKFKKNAQENKKINYSQYAVNMFKKIHLPSWFPPSHRSLAEINGCCCTTPPLFMQSTHFEDYTMWRNVNSIAYNKTWDLAVTT